MDAYSICFTSPATRSSSKIYQDLWSSRLHSLTNVNSVSKLRKLAPMEQSRQMRGAGRTSKPHVAIIGAGIAGLRCTDILLQHGCIVTIIEGRDRVGGRLHQEQLPNGHFVDMGPNWIHGTEDNPIQSLAKETNTTVGSPDNLTYIFNENGNLWSAEKSEEYSTLFWNIVQDAFAHSNEQSHDIDIGESLHDFFLKKVEEKIPSTKDGYEEKRKVIMHLSEMWGAYIGSPVHRQSMKFFWLEECLEGENLFCAGTYKKISETIAKHALGSAEIILNTKAEKISYRIDGDEKVKVLVNGGRMLEFDEVVMTAPLGWLKRNLDAFEPPLPDRLTKGIGAIGYGCLEKVYFTFPRAFWTDPDSDGRKVHGFAQWITPNYAPESNPERWHQEMVDLASLSPETSHPTLLFYTYGEQSQQLTSKAREFSTQKERDELLCSFYKPYYSRLPNFSEEDPDCHPVNCLATDWVHDELAGWGSYSNFQVGLENGDNDIRTMREGLPNQGLWFAGEHTAPFVGLGTATGAYWSGESVGQRIAEAYGLEKKAASISTTST